MNNSRLLFLLVLTAYIFSPSILAWIINPAAIWYRPFILWAILIVIAFAFQIQKQESQ